MSEQRSPTPDIYGSFVNKPANGSPSNRVPPRMADGDFVPFYDSATDDASQSDATVGDTTERKRTAFVGTGLGDVSSYNSTDDEAASQSDSVVSDRAGSWRGRGDPVGRDDMETSINSLKGGRFPLDDSSMNNLIELSSQTDTGGWSSWSNNVTVEPLMFLFMLGTTLTFPVQTILYLVHTCRGVLGYNESICSILEGKSNQTLEDLVQPTTNTYVMWATIIETCVPAALTLFIGPWSDKHGRKTFLMLPILGYALKFVMCLAFSLYPALPTGYLLLASIPVSLGGGLISVISLSYCYITDISSEQRRGFRMGMVEACFYAGLLLGTAASTYLFAAGGYAAVYGASIALCSAAFLQGVFFLDESVPNVADSDGKRVSSLFDPGLVRAMLSTCCRSRDYGRRAIIFLVIVAMSTCVLSMEGEGSVMFMFTRHKFGWDIRHFTTYGSVTILLQIVGTVVGVSVLSAWLGIADTPLAMASFGLKIAATAIQAISPQWWYMYVAAGVGMFGAVNGPLCRAIISKTVDHEDVGKVFSLLSVAEAVTPLASAPLYTFVYNATLLSFPGAFLLVTSAIYLLDFVMLLAVAIIQRLHPVPQYNRLAVE